MRHHSVRRRLAGALALVIAASGLAVATVAGPAFAAPGDNGDDGEGGSKSLIQQVEDASKGYVEAKEALGKSRKRQTQLKTTLAQLDAQLGPKQKALDEIAAQTYRTGRLGPMSALINASSSSDDFLDNAQVLANVAIRQDHALRALKDNREKQARAATAIDLEIKDQSKQLTVMAKRKTQAENALKAAGQGQDASSPGGSSNAKARPGATGSGCTADDPTTGHCITPRLLHAAQEARRAGYTRYYACWRSQNSGEHPLGRACDFASDKDGFGGDATGSSKTYGNNLAAYFINNSGTLGVLYVIWYRRIWLPSSGWKSYSGAGGDPSSDHTNHVHLSVK